MEHEKKLIEIGRKAAALLSLHLENPETFTPLEITSKLFEVFENLGLEEDFNSAEEDEVNEHGRNNP